MGSAERFAILKRFPLFSSLSDSLLFSLAKLTYEKNFAVQEQLIEQDDHSANAYFIYEGCVRVYRTREDGSVMNLSILGKGDVVGEMSLFDELPRSATVTALFPTKTILLKRHDLIPILQLHPKAAIQVLKIISQRLRQANEKIEDILHRKLVERTMKTLELICQHAGNNKIRMTHEELSCIVGATRARVTESLNILQMQKRIRQEKGSVIFVL